MMRSLAGVRVLVVAAALVALAGCGSSDSDDDKIEESLTGYFNALADGDGTAACDHLSENGQRQLAEAGSGLPQLRGLSCPELVERISTSFGKDDKAQLHGAEVGGDSATAVVEGADVDPTLVKSDGEWLIESGFTS